MIDELTDAHFADCASLVIYRFKFLRMNKPVINIDEDILGGTPVFYGTRVPIKNLFDYLETGETIQTFLEDFDSVKKEQVIRVLEMSKKLIEVSSEMLNENFVR